MKIMIGDGLPAAEKEKVDKLLKRLESAGSFEELVFSALDVGLSINLVSPPSDQKREKVIFVNFLRNNVRTPEGIEACTLIEPSLWKRWGQFELLNNNLYRFADKKGTTHDLAWFERRDKNLRLKVDTWEGEVTAPPASLWPLVASYVFSPMGVVMISREIVELKCGCPYVAKLKLLAPANHRKGQFEESISIVLSKLGALAERREACNRARAWEEFKPGANHAT